MLPPIDHIIYFPPRLWLYWIILTMVIGAVLALPFVKTTVSIRASGLIRPANERTEVKSVMSGYIHYLYVKEGDTVKQGQLIAAIRDNTNQPKADLNQIEYQQKNAFVKDLLLLTKSDTSSIKSSLGIDDLSTPLYKEQLSKYQYQLADQKASLRKVANELKTYTSLFKDKVISSKEYFDKEIEFEKLQASFNAFKNNQLVSWQHDLQEFQLNISQFNAQRRQIEADQSNHFIHSPVSGVIQNVSARYKGNMLSAGESVCLISPLTELLAECYLSTKDVGLLTVGHSVKFQIDAFDYQYFGVLTGKVNRIDNDYSIIDNKPVFKVQCYFDRAQLSLKNGFKGSLKKGLSLQARFVVAERTLWNLLYDTMDDWFNPNAHVKS